MGQRITKTAEIHGKITPGAATPVTVMGTVLLNQPPRRRRNADTRAREYLTDAEVQKLMKAAGDNRNWHRDATMVLLAYRHGLRPVELVTLRWDAIDFTPMGKSMSAAPRTAHRRFIRSAASSACPAPPQT